MHIPGHIAVAIAQHRLISIPDHNEETIKPLILASLFPDLVDKTIGYIFHVMPNGRHYAHNLFSLVMVSLLVGLIWGRTAGYAWFIGYLGHLLADGGRMQMVPWLFPAKRYRFYKGKLSFNPAQLLRESLILALVIIIYRYSLPPDPRHVEHP